MMRLKEIIHKGIKDGIIRNKADLASEMWRDSPKKSATACLYRLINGDADSIKIKDVYFLCNKFRISADYLFGLTDIPNIQQHNVEIKNSLHDTIDKLREITNTI